MRNERSAVYTVHFEKFRWTAWKFLILALWSNYHSLQN